MASIKSTTSTATTATVVVVPMLVHNGTTSNEFDWREKICQSAESAFPGNGECLRTGKLYVFPEPVLKVILPEPTLGQSPTPEQLEQHAALMEKNRVNRKINDTLATKHAMDVANQPQILKNIFNHAFNSISKASVDRIKAKAANEAGLKAHDPIQLMAMVRTTHTTTELGVEILERLEHTRNFLNFRAKPGQSLLDIKEEAARLAEISGTQGMGSLGAHTEAFTAAVYVKAVDSRFQPAVVQMINNHVNGLMTFPDSTEEVFQSMSNFRVVATAAKSNSDGLGASIYAVGAKTPKKPPNNKKQGDSTNSKKSSSDSGGNSANSKKSSSEGPPLRRDGTPVTCFYKKADGTLCSSWNMGKSTSGALGAPQVSV